MEAKSPPQNDRTTGFEVRYQHAIVEAPPTMQAGWRASS